MRIAKMSVAGASRLWLAVRKIHPTESTDLYGASDPRKKQSTSTDSATPSTYF
jgi:hypothetical protein